MTKRQADTQDPMAGNHGSSLYTEGPAAGPASPLRRKKQKCHDDRRSGFRIHLKRTEHGWCAKVTQSCVPTALGDIECATPKPIILGSAPPSSGNDRVTGDSSMPKTPEPTFEPDANIQTQEHETKQDVAVPKTAKKKNTSKGRLNRKPTANSKAKAKGNAGGKKSTSCPLPSVTHVTRATRVNKAVKAKIEQVRAFVRHSPLHGTILKRDPAHPDHVVVAKSALLAAIKSMRVDYRVGHEDEPTTAADVKEAIAGQHRETIGTGTTPITHYTLKVSVPAKTAFERLIQKRVAGHGLEGVNLLAVELEMNSKQLEAVAANNLLRMVDADPNETDGEDTGLSAADVC